MNPAPHLQTKTTAAQIAAVQRRADIAHHQQRVTWLSKANPRWDDGTPVSPSWKHKLLAQSQDCLANPARATNTCHCRPRCAPLDTVAKKS